MVSLALCGHVRKDLIQDFAMDWRPLMRLPPGLVTGSAKGCNVDGAACGASRNGLRRGLCDSFQAVVALLFFCARDFVGRARRGRSATVAAAACCLCRQGSLAPLRAQTLAGPRPDFISVSARSTRRARVRRSARQRKPSGDDVLRGGEARSGFACVLEIATAGARVSFFVAGCNWAAGFWLA